MVCSVTVRSPSGRFTMVTEFMNRSVTKWLSTTSSKSATTHHAAHVSVGLRKRCKGLARCWGRSPDTCRRRPRFPIGRRLQRQPHYPPLEPWNVALLTLQPA